MENLGFIGLGIMGLPMATNLVKKSNCPVLGFDLVEESKLKFSNVGGKIATDKMEIYKTSTIIFLCLPKNELIESVVKEIIEFGQKETVIITE